MNKLLSVFILSFCLPVFLFAQNKTIKGKVADEDGNGVPNANVVQKGGIRKGTQTDKDGNFSLVIKDEPKISLTISSVGYGTRVVNVTGDNVAVMLEKKVNVQDEVVVVGYQTVKRGDINGAVSSVTADQIKDIPATTGAEALTGRAAGVQVTSSEGGPGADYDVKLRGGIAITQDNSPLYIVDGVAVDNALSVIAPQDIQSFDILKDAAATAIYGSRGANGVIVITTKGGKLNKKLSVSYNTFFGWKELSKELDVLSPYDFVKYQYEKYGADSMSSDNLSSFVQRFGTANFDSLGTIYKNTQPIDWQKKLFGRKGMQQMHNLTLSGGSERTTYALSLSLNREDGVLISSDYERKLASLKIDHKASEKLKFGLTARYNSSTLNGAGVSGDNQNFSRLRHTIKYIPFENSYYGVDEDVDFDLASNGQGILNPVLLSQQEQKQVENSIVNITANATYNITKWLSFRTTVGVENNNKFTRQFGDSSTPAARNGGGFLPYASIDSLQKFTLTNSNVLTFRNNSFKSSFNKKNSFELILGQENIKQQYMDNLSKLSQYPKWVSYQDIWNNMYGYGAIKDANVQAKYQSESKLLSFFGKLNYAYKKKYLASFSYRADGSSKFNVGQQWGYFPAGSLAWVVSKEKFLSNAKWLSNLKLRLTYGTSGNNRIDDYSYLPLYNIDGTEAYYLNDVRNTAYVPYTPAAGSTTFLYNTNITWETSTAKNLGIDISLFKEAVQLTVDIYQNNANNLLVAYNLPSTAGFTYQYQNVGKTRNRGMEFQLTLPRIISKKNFNWSANFNMSFNKNTVVSLGTLPEKLESTGLIGALHPADYYLKPGQPLGQMYGYINDGFYTADEFTGYDGKYFIPKSTTLLNNTSYGKVIPGTFKPQPGEIKFKDISGPNGVPDGIVDKYDQTVIGNANPKFYGGLNQQLSYKRFDFSIFVNWVYGNDVYNANKIDLTNEYVPNANMLNVMAGAWTNIDENGHKITDLAVLKERNKNATIWRAVEGTPYFNAMSWAIEDGSFLRFNNATLGYTFKPRKFVKSLRVYATVNNIAVITSYTGYDPEVNAKRSGVYPTPGVDYSTYPKSRSYLFGLNVTF